MPGMIQEYSCDDYIKLFGTDVTDGTFSTTVAIPTVTEPVASATRGVFDLALTGGSYSRNLMELIPIGTGINNAVITGLRVFGWTRLKGVGGLSAPTKDLWVPKLLFAADMVFGNVIGVAGSALASTYFFMDTITITSGIGNANVDNVITTNALDLVASVLFDTKGSQKIEALVDLGANATAFNLLARRM